MKRILLLAILMLAALQAPAQKANVKGRVTCDGKGVAGVQVSDGHQIVTTDAKGRYSMYTDKKDSVVFITTPSGYVAKRSNSMRPDFFALLTKSPKKTEKHDFKLEKQDQSNYSVVFITDVHFGRIVENNVDKENFKNKVFPNLQKLTSERQAAGKAVFCFELGDFAHDEYWYENGCDEIKAFHFLASLNYTAPTFGVSGNHDNDGSITEDDFKSAWQLRRTWGPDRYSMNINNDHWILLDNIFYVNTPGNGPFKKGIKGKRDYICKLTDSQLEWLRKDVASVPEGTNIYLCTHAPIFNTHRPDEKISDEQIAVLDQIFAKFPKVTCYSGHAHMMHFPSTGEYTRFEQFVLPATSGSMWQTDVLGFQSTSSDGTDAGVFLGDNYASGKVDYDYVTNSYGPKYMRVYDMNGVAAYYEANDDVHYQMAIYPEHRHDFAEPRYKDMIFVNYWFHRPGETVHIIENGEELEVKKEKMEDPFYNIAYFVPASIKAGEFKKSLCRYRYPHMFTAKAKTSDAPVLIRITDADGRIVREQTLIRPKAFNENID